MVATEFTRKDIYSIYKNINFNFSYNCYEKYNIFNIISCVLNISKPLVYSEICQKEKNSLYSFPSKDVYGL